MSSPAHEAQPLLGHPERPPTHADDTREKEEGRKRLMLILCLVCIPATLVVGGTAAAFALAGSSRGGGSTPPHPPPLSNLTFADLAGKFVPAKFNQIAGQLALLTPTSTPDLPKDLRLSLLYAREIMDIFSYAYPPKAPEPAPGPDLTKGKGKPKPKPKAADLYLEIRAQLDVGYETLGNFQDLARSGVKYNQTDVDILRAVCLEWKAGFLEHSGAAYTAYLAAPVQDTLFEHKKLSKLFWGYNGTRPSLKLSGYGNMALLASSLIAGAQQDLPALLALAHVYEDKEHEQFHMYRKLLRSIFAVFLNFKAILPGGGNKLNELAAPTTPTLEALFPSRRMLQGAKGSSRALAPAPECPSVPSGHEFLTALSKAFQDMGGVNNNINAYEFYTKKGMAKEAEASRQLVVSGWAALTLWMGNNLPRQLACVQQSVVDTWLSTASL